MIPISLSEKFCCQNLITSIKVINMTRNSSKSPKISDRYLKSGIEVFHRKYVLVPVDKASNNVVVV